MSISAPSSLRPKRKKVDRPGADGAAAGEGNPCLVGASEERADHPEAGAHYRDQFVGCGGVDDVGGVERHALAGEVVGAVAAAVDRDINAMILKDFLELLDVGQARHVLQNERFRCEQRGDHERQGGVFCARNGDFSPELAAADDPDSIHELCPRYRRLAPAVLLANRTAPRKAGPES